MRTVLGSFLFSNLVIYTKMTKLNLIAEFAKAEYGLSKDIVSRYIAINDRYSEGGYSDRLQDKYEKT